LYFDGFDRNNTEICEKYFVNSVLQTVTEFGKLLD